MYGEYPDLKKVKKILVVKLRHLGDVLLTSPVFQVLKKELPDCEIDAYIYKSALPMLEGHPCISEILLYDREIKNYNFLKRLVEEIKILKKIRSKKYDLVLNLTEGDRGAIVAKASRAEYTIGYKSNQGIKGKDKIYSHFVKSSGSRHMVEQNLDFVRRIGIFPKIEDRDLFFSIPNDAYLNISMILKEHNIDEKNFILIHPASRWRFKCWPAFRMKNLSKMLVEKNIQIVFTAGNEPFEKQMVKEIIESLPKTHVLNLAGKVSLKELGALIDMCRLLLCVDSVPLHMASALKAKCICLFGPTVDKTWGPWKNDNALVISQNYSCRPCCLDGCGGSKISDCLYSIEEDRVFNEILARI
jgi:heptosyltransferase-3